MDLQQAQKAMQLDRMGHQIDELEGKAVTAADRIQILDLRFEYVGARLSLAIQEKRGLDAKAFAGMAREKRRSLRRFIEDIGGSAADGGYATDLLDFEPHHVERAMELIRGEASPETDDERAALERWQEKHA